MKRIGQFISALESIQKREEICGLVVPRNLKEQVGFEPGLKERWNLDKHSWGGSISVEENRVQFPSLDRAKLLVILATSV